MNGGRCFFLPEACIANVLSFTSPRDACRASSVSAVFRSAAASDTVWDRFLPSDCKEMVLSRASNPPPMDGLSKRDLFFLLCEPILIDGGDMCFFLERSSGCKCFMLSARKLLIRKGINEDCSLIEMPESRFQESAVLFADWFYIIGEINSRMLSAETNYAAYLVFGQRSGTLHETAVKLGGQATWRVVRLCQMDVGDGDGNVSVEFDSFGDRAHAPRLREDGWMEVEMGEFFNGGGDGGKVEISSWPSDDESGLGFAGWLVIDGIEVRPKPSARA